MDPKPSTSQISPKNIAKLLISILLIIAVGVIGLLLMPPMKEEFIVTDYSTDRPIGGAEVTIKEFRISNDQTNQISSKSIMAGNDGLFYIRRSSTLHTVISVSHKDFLSTEIVWPSGSVYYHYAEGNPVRSGWGVGFKGFYPRNIWLTNTNDNWKANTVTSSTNDHHPKTALGDDAPSPDKVGATEAQVVSG